MQNLPKVIYLHISTFSEEDICRCKISKNYQCNLHHTCHYKKKHHCEQHILIKQFLRNKNIICVCVISSMFNSIRYNKSLHVTQSKWFELATIELYANPPLPFHIELLRQIYLTIILHITIPVEDISNCPLNLDPQTCKQGGLVSVLLSYIHQHH